MRGSAPSPASFRYSRVFLIGYRATGKSTVARIVADRLGWDWIDADAVLERQVGKTIRQIFEAEGESGFRARESELLLELCGTEHVVVATGGGVILREENQERLKSSGFRVWLTADAATIWKRLQTDVTTSERRPALTVGGLAEVQQLLRVREPLYRMCADITVATTARNPGAIAEEIIQRLSEA